MVSDQKRQVTQKLRNQDSLLYVCCIVNLATNPPNPTKSNSENSEYLHPSSYQLGLLANTLSY